MLTKVEVIANGGVKLTLPVQSLSEGYLIRDITGLDPVKATIVSSSFANMDGEQYQSSRRGSRNIVFKLGLTPDYGTGSVSELRSRLYGFFMPKSQVSLAFYREGKPTTYISAIVESFDCPIFVQDPEATISLICHQPDFMSGDPLVFVGNSVSDESEFLINYEGTIDTGLLLTLDPDREIDGFTLYHRDLEDSVSALAFSGILSAGDSITISTISGAKGATLYQADTYSSVLYGVSPYSHWIHLNPGLNYLSVNVEGVAIPYRLEYVVRHGGL